MRLFKTQYMVGKKHWKIYKTIWEAHLSNLKWTKERIFRFTAPIYYSEAERIAHDIMKDYYGREFGLDYIVKILPNRN